MLGCLKSVCTSNSNKNAIKLPVPIYDKPMQSIADKGKILSNLIE